MFLGIQSPVKGETTEEEYRKKEFEDLCGTSKTLFDTSNLNDPKKLLLCYRLKFGTIPFMWLAKSCVDENFSSEDLSIVSIFSAMMEIVEDLNECFWLSIRFYQSSRRFRNQYDLLVSIEYNLKSN